MTLAPPHGYDLWAPGYDDHDLSTALDEPLVLALCGEVAQRRVLDVACGTGRYAYLLAERGARVTGLDASRDMLARAQRGDAHGIEWVHGHANELPFSDESFERVTCGLLLDHVDELLPVFCEMARVLQSGGRAVVSTVHPEMQRLTGAAVRLGESENMAAVIHDIEDIEAAAALAGLRASRRYEPLVTSEMGRDSRWAWRVGVPALLVLALDR